MWLYCNPLVYSTLYEMYIGPWPSIVIKVTHTIDVWVCLGWRRHGRRRLISNLYVCEAKWNYKLCCDTISFDHQVETACACIVKTRQIANMVPVSNKFVHLHTRTSHAVMLRLPLFDFYFCFVFYSSAIIQHRVHWLFPFHRRKNAHHILKTEEGKKKQKEKC